MVLSRTRGSPCFLTQALVLQGERHHTALFGRTVCLRHTFLNWPLSRNSLGSTRAPSMNSLPVARLFLGPSLVHRGPAHARRHRPQTSGSVPLLSLTRTSSIHRGACTTCKILRVMHIYRRLLCKARMTMDRQKLTLESECCLSYSTNLGASDPGKASPDMS